MADVCCLVSETGLILQCLSTSLDLPFHFQDCNILEEEWLWDLNSSKHAGYNLATPVGINCLLASFCLFCFWDLHGFSLKGFCIWHLHAWVASLFLVLFPSFVDSFWCVPESSHMLTSNVAPFGQLGSNRLVCFSHFQIVFLVWKIFNS